MKNNRRWSEWKLKEMRKDWSSIPFSDFIKKWEFKHGLVCRTFREMNKMLKGAGLREAE